MARRDWTQEELVALARHPDRTVRYWAIHRLGRRFPREGAALAIHWLRAKDERSAVEALELIGRSGTRAEALQVLDHLRYYRNQETLLHTAITALGALRLVEALPVARLLIDDPDADGNSRIASMELLGWLGDDRDRRRLMEALCDPSERDTEWHGALRSLLALHRVDDLRWVLRGVPDGARGRAELPARAIAKSLGLGYFFDPRDERPAMDLPLEKTADNVRNLLGVRVLPFSPICLKGLAETMPGTPTWFAVLQGEASRLVRARGDDIEGWEQRMRAGERLRGYRWWAPATLALLQVAAERPANAHMAEVCLLATANLALDRDDEAALAAAPDRAQAELELVTSSRPRVHPPALEAVCRMGRAAVPALRQAALTHKHYVTLLRQIVALRYIAERDPEGAAPAIDALLEPADYREYHMTVESGRALMAIGPCGIPQIRAVVEREPHFHLLETLGVFSDPLVTDYLRTTDPDEQWGEWLYGWLHVVTGDPAGVEVMAPRWHPGQHHEAEVLVTLCALNGIKHPKLRAWRKDIAEWDKRYEKY